LPQALTVEVTDQYGNPVSGSSVTFSDGGAGGTFSNSNPVVTSSSGIASQFYTLPASPGTVTISASAAGLTSAVFTETGQ
jgi:protocatechuate 3,4-dioxygenase beta subunit